MRARSTSPINPHVLDHVKRCLAAGAFVSIAIHDATLIQALIDRVRRKAVDPATFEFQMLFGVCEPLRHRLRDQGFPVRISVPFGADWYGYSTRRLKENPRIAGHGARAVFAR